MYPVLSGKINDQHIIVMEEKGTMENVVADVAVVIDKVMVDVLKAETAMGNVDNEEVGQGGNGSGGQAQQDQFGQIRLWWRLWLLGMWREPYGARDLFWLWRW